MARRVLQVCDYRGSFEPDAPVCGHPATIEFHSTVDGLEFNGDLCETHRDEVVKRITAFAGMHVVAPRTDHSTRARYVTTSGAIVTAKEIRAWALDSGRSTSGHGRLSTDLIHEYLDAH